MTPEQRQPLEIVSRELLEFHKVLLDWERARYEAEHGRIGSPGEFLSLVLDHPQFAWLRRLSGLIVELDEALAPRSKAGIDVANAVLAQTRRLLQTDAGDGDFQQRLAAAVEDSPEAAALRAHLLARF